MIVDLLIIAFAISAFFRGREIGFVQQSLSTIGFFGGLFLGAALQPQTIQLVHGQLNRSLISLVTTLGTAFLCLTIGEIIGITLKKKLPLGKLNSLDNSFGGILSVVSILIAVWLSAGVVRSLPYAGVQQQFDESKIVRNLESHLPYAPNIIASLGQLIDPNGFPQVFSGGEPTPPPVINLPSRSQLAAAVNRDRASVVKIVGRGCGGVVDGSGFVAGNGLVVTNAHVVAGISHPFVQDTNGSHSATVIWFDPDLDLAILRTNNLAGEPLVTQAAEVPAGTAAATLGYPGGGGFTANPAAVLDAFTANGRNIYGNGDVERRVYEIASDVEPGNSGGPLIAADGTVIGVVFAKSTNHNNVGYTLTMQPVIAAINRAAAQNTAVSTRSCAE